MKYIEPVGVLGPANAYGHDYVDKNAGAGQAGSFVAADAIEHPMLELVTLVAKSGLAPSEADLQQVARAIRSQRMNYVQAVSGSANALSLTLDPAPASWAEMLGVPLRCPIVNPNTAAATGAIAGLAGTKSIVRNDNGVGLVGGELSGIITLIFDGTSLRLMNAPALGRLLRTTIYTRVAGVQYVQVDGGAPTTVGAGSFTSHPQASKAMVEGTSAGAAGGGAAATSSTQFSFGCGGNPGAYGLVFIPGQLSGIPVTLGAPGVGVLGAAGGNSQATTFGSLITFPGAGGAPASAPTNNAATGSAGSPSGPVTVSGAAVLLKNVFGGGAAFLGFIIPSLSIGMPGIGGAGMFGQNAYASASGFGNGGGGKLNVANAAAQAGGDGGAPFIKIDEYA